MAVPRDPAFWKRFSIAVRLDEEAQSPNFKEQRKDSWLLREQAKRSRRTYICYAFWIGLLVFIAGVVAVVIWMLQSGVLKGLQGPDPGTQPQGQQSGQGGNS